MKRIGNSPIVCSVTLLNAEYYRKLISDNTKNTEFNQLPLWIC